MKALIVHPGPAFSVADVYNGWAKGLEQVGVHVEGFNLDARVDFYTAAKLEHDGETRNAFSTEVAVALALKGLEAACYEYWPDIVLIISGFYFDECVCELIRMRGHKLVLIHTESPYEDDRQIQAAQSADLNVVNDPTNIERFPAGTVYLPHCYDPDVHYPRDPVKGMEAGLLFRRHRIPVAHRVPRAGRLGPGST
jgi:spore maturation protein CgeB